jgi:hygromycin-B 4-O-kinase
MREIINQSSRPIAKRYQSRVKGLSAAMNSIKPVVEQEMILALLRETFALPIEALTPIEGGQVAQTFSFTAGDQAYVLRFNPGSFDVTFAKELFIATHFASPRIPILPILKVGRLGDLSYAISRKRAGRRLLALSRAEYEQTMPSLMQTLHAIHQVDVGTWPGFGWIGDDGAGMFSSWQGFVARIIEEEHADGFFGKWHALFETTFLEREFFETVYRRMLRLLPFCPEERRLVHGGYGFNNVLAEGGAVTAVLDWTDAMYGDFLFDVAWLAFWDPGRDYQTLFRADYAEKGVAVPDFEQRLLCYQCYIALDGLRFNAKFNNVTAYNWVKGRITELLRT